FYRVSQIFYAVVWSSRISMLFTVVRMTFPGPLRRWLVCTAIAFMVAWMILGAQIFWTCAAQSSWKMQPRPQCDLGRNPAITQIITDVLSDTILILAPFHLICKIRLNKAQKIRLMSVFSTSGITTVVSLTHAYYVLSDGGLKEGLTAIVESSISLIVANLSVLVAFLFRISPEKTTTPTPPELTSIITVDLERDTVRYPHSDGAVIENTETKLGDFSMFPKQAAGRESSDAEAVSLETLTKPGLWNDA
ncbi:hypothetical protein F5J12DRAFT_722404, partial [Pisolithus orientalis]|uniref:uncharacterized protein n=1 Tax=Pisolithus orientalis TaxID=936130 RepID=UPI00222423E1